MKGVKVVLMILVILVLGSLILVLSNNSDKVSSDFKGSSDPVALAKTIWDCYHVQDEKCFDYYTTERLLSKCSDEGDNGCFDTQKSIANYLILTDQFDVEEEALRFELDSQNGTDAIVLVYTPASGEYFPNTLYFKRVGDGWFYDGVDLS
jgi:hypothetical protein